MQKGPLSLRRNGPLATRVSLAEFVPAPRKLSIKSALCGILPTSPRSVNAYNPAFHGFPLAHQCLSLPGTVGRLRPGRNHFLSDLLPLDGRGDVVVLRIGRLHAEADARGTPLDAARLRRLPVPVAGSAWR